MSNVKHFGATGDGKTDDTAAIRHAISDGDGVLELPRGDYVISEPIVINLDDTGRLAVRGDGVAKLIMTGPGPALHVVGTHGGTGSPTSFQPNVWQSQRLPTFSNFEIEGRHKEADGIRIEQTMQATFEGVLIRQVRHGIHVVKRNRNFIINGCHVYHNTGAGVFLDGVNLHQAIITGSHISYNRLGGIRIERSEVRNLQITGNDIEYNNFRVFDTEPTPVADVLIDCSAEGSSVREGTLVSNTIQATQSEGGANVRIIGAEGNDYGTTGMWTIGDNLIGSQETNVELLHCRGVTLTGNFIYTGHRRNLLLRGCTNVTLGSNTLDHNHSRGLELHVGARFEDCEGVAVNGCIVHDHPKLNGGANGDADGGANGGAANANNVKNANNAAARLGTIELIRCRRVSLIGCQIIDPSPVGVHVEACNMVSVQSCHILDQRDKAAMRAAVRFTGQGGANVVASNTLWRGTAHLIEAPDVSGVTQRDNVIAG